MNERNIFISVGGTANDKQETFVRAIEERLKSENLVPNTVGRNKFGADSPLKTVIDLMNDCSGTIIIAMERSYFPTGIEKRGGTNEVALIDTKYPTPWNQIEAAMAYTKGHPLMLIIEKGLKSEGLLEKGNDWYVLWANPDISVLTTLEFNGVFSSWKKKVEDYHKRKNAVAQKTSLPDPSNLTIGELIKGLKPSSIWAIFVALAGLLAGAFALGQYLGK